MSFLIETLAANAGAGSPQTRMRTVAAKAVFDFITNDSIGAIAVNAGGSGYVVGETFDITVPLSPGNVTEVFTAVGVVTSVGSPVGAGVVTGVKIVSGGAYTNLVQSPELTLTGVATTNASASGDDLLTVDLTPEAAHWDEERGNGLLSPIPSTDYVDDNTDFHWICTSRKASNPATIGVKTLLSGGLDFFQIMVSSGFDNSQDFFTQPDNSPTGGSGTAIPVIPVPLNNLTIYVSSTERRVNLLLRDGSFNHYGCLGFFIPFTDTEANYPFPGIVAGTTVGAVAFNTGYVEGNGSSPGTQTAGIVHPMTLQTGILNGPYYIRNNTSPDWLPVNDITNEATARPICVWPHRADDQNYDFSHAPQVSGFSTNPQVNDGYNANILHDGSFGWFRVATSGSLADPGVAPFGLSNRLSFVVQPHFIRNLTNNVEVIGLLDGFEAVHGVGLTSYQEIEQFNGKRYIVFPDCTAGPLYLWCAMEIV